MNVGELIEELRKAPRNLEVWLMIDDTFTVAESVKFDEDTLEILGEST
jgi:hypothetical protein